MQVCLRLERLFVLLVVNGANREAFLHEIAFLIYSIPLCNSTPLVIIDRNVSQRCHWHVRIDSARWLVFDFFQFFRNEWVEFGLLAVVFGGKAPIVVHKMTLGVSYMWVHWDVGLYRHQLAVKHGILFVDTSPLIANAHGKIHSLVSQFAHVSLLCHVAAATGEGWKLFPRRTRMKMLHHSPSILKMRSLTLVCLFNHLLMAYHWCPGYSWTVAGFLKLSLTFCLYTLGLASYFYTQINTYRLRWSELICFMKSLLIYL